MIVKFLRLAQRLLSMIALVAGLGAAAAWALR
jgi:hypothetical protein